MGRRRIWIAIALAAAGAAAAVAWLLALRDTPSPPVGVDRAVERFRADWAAGGRDEPGGLRAAVPRAGVYTYAARGFETATVLGRDARHAYPATATLTVLPSACGLSARLDLLSARSSTWHVCARDGAWRVARLRDVHRFFGRLDDRTYRCDARSVWTALSGAWRARCVVAGTTQRWRARVLSTAPVDVGGRRVPAVHVRLRSRTGGETQGTGTEDLWLVRDSGLPARWVIRNSSTTDTVAGAVAYRESIDLRLLALTPRR
jgi:hypothetical protein